MTENQNSLKKRKISIERENVGIVFSHYSHKGRRQSMEDAHIMMDANDCVLKFPELLKVNARVALFGILDGHGGSNVSKYVSENLPSILINNMLANGQDFTNGTKITTAITASFSSMESMVRVQCEKEGWTDGSCCILAVFVNDVIYIANLGDSKAVLCRRLKKKGPPSLSIVPHIDVSGGNGGRASILSHTFPWDHGSASPPPPAAEYLALTVDHKPAQLPERERVEKCGGRVEGGRVVCSSGLLYLSLAITRSFGDEAMKRYGVTAEPDVRIKLSISARSNRVPRKGKQTLLAKSASGSSCTNSATPGPLSADSGAQGSVHVTSEIVKPVDRLCADVINSANSKGGNIEPEAEAVSAPAPNAPASTVSAVPTAQVIKSAPSPAAAGLGMEGAASAEGEGVRGDRVGVEDEGGQCELLILGCDGLWDRFSERAVVAFVRTRLYAGVSWREGREHSWTLPNITRGLVEDAIFEKGSQDNVSAIVIQFIHSDGHLPHPPQIYSVGETAKSSTSK